MVLQAVQTVASASIQSNGFRVTESELIAIIVAFISFLAFIFQFLKYQEDKRKDTIEDGVRLERMERLTQDMERIRLDLKDLENRINASVPETAEMKNDIKHIMESLARIEGKLERGS